MTSCTRSGVGSGWKPGTRVIWVLACVALACVPALMIGGCPTTPGTIDNTNGPSGDPNSPGGVAASINVSSSAPVLMFNAPGFNPPPFPKSATLAANVSNAPSTATVDWRITPRGNAGTFLSFSTTSNTQTATGTSVIVTVTGAPSADVIHDIIATANFADGGTVVATTTIRVAPDIQVGGNSTIFTVTPFATPPTGQDANGNLSLNAGDSGGKGTVVYQWAALAAVPDTVEVPANLTTNPLVLHVSGPATGVFPFRVTATDSAGNVATGLVNVILAIPNAASLNVDVSATRSQTSAGTVFLHTIRTGGVQDPNGAGTADTFTYSWRILNQTGGVVSATIAPEPGLNDNTEIDWTVTGLTTPGTYRFEVTVTDPFNFSDTDSVHVELGDLFSLDIASADNDYIVDPSGTLTFNMNRTGGVPPFTYSLTQDGPGALTGVFSSTSISAADDATVDWTAPAASVGAEGSYKITATVTDLVGNSVTDSLWVSVQASSPLSLDVRSADNNYLTVPGGTVTLNFDRSGGAGDFSYAFVQDGPGAFVGAFGSTSPVSSSDDTSVTWTAPAAAVGVRGTYRITVTVTDALGHAATDSVWITVDADQPLSLDVRPQDAAGINTYILQPTESVTLRLDVTGGIGPYSYAFGQDGPNACLGGFSVASPLISAGDGLVDWTAPAAAPGCDGAYRIQVVVTDALGSTFTDSVNLFVQADQPLSLDVRSTDNNYIVAPGGTQNIRFDVSGGVGPYDYTFGQDGPGVCAGAFVPPNGDPTTIDVVGDLFVDWTAPNTNGCNGSYRVQVVVTDALGHTFTDSIDLFVQGSQSVGLDVQTARVQISPTSGLQDQLLRTVRTGGIGDATTGNFNYAWTVIDSAGNNDSANFTGPTIDAGSTLAGTTINWDVTPTTATADTYRFFCTVTDPFTNDTWTASAEILVADVLSLDARSTDNNYIVAPSATQNLRFDVTGGVPPYDYAFGQDGPGANAGAFSPPTDVLDQAGDLFVDWTAPAAAPGVGGTYRIQVTVTDNVGNHFTDSLDLLVEAPTPLSLDVRSDNYSISEGTAAVATLTLDVTGGVANYRYDYTVFDNTGTPIASQSDYVNPDSPSTGNAGDLTVTFDPLGEDGAGGNADLAAGFYTVVVTVTDALGSTFTDSVAIEVVP